jgi:hypothetical protein
MFLSLRLVSFFVLFKFDLSLFMIIWHKLQDEDDDVANLLDFEDDPVSAKISHIVRHSTHPNMPREVKEYLKDFLNAKYLPVF